jgi:hypothetical protein
MSEPDFIKRLEGKPDGSYVLVDADGRERSGRMPPTLLQQILQHPGVQKLARVRVREPDDSIRDDFWPVDEATVARLSHDGILHVMSLFEDGEARYYFIAKRVWDRLDELLAIFMNPSLSASEKQVRANALIRG